MEWNTLVFSNNNNKKTSDFWICSTRKNKSALGQNGDRMSQKIRTFVFIHWSSGCNIWS
jgi:hypothetical protein